VQKRFFGNRAPDSVAFSKKHGVDRAHVENIFTGTEYYFSPEMCRALAADTLMSEGFFRNLNEQYRQKMAA